jgi:hypothetical protein
MSAVQKGLKAIKAAQAERAAAAEAANRPKAEWFKLKPNQGVKLRFLQELDDESEGYSPERGLGFIAVEHNAPGPEGYKRRGLCSMDDEGRCYADERHRQDPKAGWRQKQNLYINVLVDYGDGEKKVNVLTRNANSGFTNNLIEWASDNGTITNVVFTVKRTGEGTQTQWSLMPVMKDDIVAEFPLDGHELYDLEAQLRKVEYDKQPAFYGEVSSEATPQPVSVGAAAEDEW